MSHLYIRNETFSIAKAKPDSKTHVDVIFCGIGDDRADMSSVATLKKNESLGNDNATTVHA